jgi:DNA replication factor GINS
MTSEERTLFDDLVTRIKRSRQTVLDTLAGGSKTGDTATGSTAEAAADDRSGETLEPTRESEGPDATAGPADDLLADAMGGRPGTNEAPVESEPEPKEPREPREPSATRDDPQGPAGSSEPRDAETTAASADESGQATESGQASDPGGHGSNGVDDQSTDVTERTTVRITRNVGSIFGVDEREYDLASEDVVTLPTANAKPLLEGDAAERLE